MAVSGGCARSEGRIWWVNTEDRWPRKYRRRLAVDVEQQRRKKSSSAAAQEEADLDGMQNGQVAEGGRIGMGWGCAVQEARRTHSRAGQGMAGKATYRTGLDRIGHTLLVCTCTYSPKGPGPWLLPVRRHRVAINNNNTYILEVNQSHRRKRASGAPYKRARECSGKACRRSALPCPAMPWLDCLADSGFCLLSSGSSLSLCAW
jgi:hypothetical protein